MADKFHVVKWHVDKYQLSKRWVLANAGIRKTVCKDITEIESKSRGLPGAALNIYNGHLRV